MLRELKAWTSQRSSPKHSGRQPVGLTARKLMADTRLPLEWSEQRTALGFA